MKTITLLFVLIMVQTGCSFESPRLDGKSKIPVFKIICEHPLKGYVTYLVKDTYSNIRPYKGRSSIWFFTDIKGVLVETSFKCYTDSTMKGFVKK